MLSGGSNAPRGIKQIILGYISSLHVTLLLSEDVSCGWKSWKTGSKYFCCPYKQSDCLLCGCLSSSMALGLKFIELSYSPEYIDLLPWLNCFTSFIQAASSFLLILMLGLGELSLVNSQFTDRKSSKNTKSVQFLKYTDLILFLVVVLMHVFFFIVGIYAWIWAETGYKWHFSCLCDVL